jgi:hypothetical protein
MIALRVAGSIRLQAVISSIVRMQPTQIRSVG